MTAARMYLQVKWTFLELKDEALPDPFTLKMRRSPSEGSLGQQGSGVFSLYRVPEFPQLRAAKPYEDIDQGSDDQDDTPLSRAIRKQQGEDHDLNESSTAEQKNLPGKKTRSRPGKRRRDRMKNLVATNMAEHGEPCTGDLKQRITEQPTSRTQVYLRKILQGYYY
eukprot:TRINITY_DN21138_c0_g1_i1.p1 TRINITY_DN21138_c0_g1~~TRINITY_DN21138_c0_g1_i1.p1  ORF type:complete len:166 (+),score=33.58 TRINITY_DN21138_c0_g1_i1:158-655(+)